MNATPAFDRTPSPLMEEILHSIQQAGPLNFKAYMAMALYHPQWGYYSGHRQRVGTDADFITSVSVGPCFGMLLARRILTHWQESQNPESYHIIEPGAHHGELCCDILDTLAKLSPDCYHSVRYHLVETTPALRAAQEKRLASRHPDKYHTHTSLGEIKQSIGPVIGTILSNELIDAFPVHLIQSNNGEWQELMVESVDGETLTLAAHPLSSAELIAFCQSLGRHYPDGYTSEYNSGIDRFVNDAAELLKSGLMITIDYGHAQDDYYHPDRTSGTLQTYYRHQKSDNPLLHPGEIDITTHVDFTRLQHGAEARGFHSASLRTQASYLTEQAREWLLDIENPDSTNHPDTPKLLRQFQTLIHPAMLGTKFSVLEMSR
ncbi:SAM-dependent methyltransferase [Verrucomicrobiaceae bacterium N1E253]|uniref:SAM-dependent methyltransferase n=1 Tax=Oceaniferula marina TaxID=2748318 RepID=A0A851GMV0_9BACT|nr:SAM-dependent methyltransferase [Oceaniferula marina]NWK56465.1 SAM-dependent methyltransferase [Oceaniferula marina]